MKGELAFTVGLFLMIGLCFDGPAGRKYIAWGFYILALLSASRLLWLVAFQ